MSLLRNFCGLHFFRLSIDIKIDFIDAGLRSGARRSVPVSRAQPDSAELVHRETTPAHRSGRAHQATVTASLKLITKGVEPT